MNKGLSQEFLDCVLDKYNKRVANRRLHLAISDRDAYKAYWKSSVIDAVQQWIDDDRDFDGVNVVYAASHNPTNKTLATLVVA